MTTGIGPRQGALFDQQCRLLLRGLGFTVSDIPFMVPDVGIEVDADIEVSGRTDTVKKALADALLLHVAADDYPPMLLLTSHLPAGGTSGHRMIEVALKSGALFDAICVNEPADLARLEALAE